MFKSKLVLAELRKNIEATGNLSKLARESGVNVETIRNIRNNYKVNPTIGTVEAIFDACEKINGII